MKKKYFTPKVLSKKAFWKRVNKHLYESVEDTDIKVNLKPSKIVFDITSDMINVLYDGDDKEYWVGSIDPSVNISSARLHSYITEKARDRKVPAYLWD